MLQDSLLNVHYVAEATDSTSMFPELFSDGLGMLCGVKATIRVPEDAQLRIFWPRTVSFTLLDLEDQEIQTL